MVCHFILGLTYRYKKQHTATQLYDFRLLEEVPSGHLHREYVNSIQSGPNQVCGLSLEFS